MAKIQMCNFCNKEVLPWQRKMFQERRKSIPSYALGAGSGTLRTVKTYSAYHADCFADQVESDRCQRDLEAIDRECALALKYGETEEYVAEYRAKRMKEVE